MPATASEGRTAAAWRFRGGAVRPDRGLDDAIPRLFEALRVAAGLGAQVELRWTAGRHGGVEIRAGDGATARWVEGSLLAAYPDGTWVRGEPLGDPELPARAVAAARSGDGSSFRERTLESPPWADAAMAALLALPDCAVVRWRLRAIGVPSPTGFSPVPLVAPLGTRLPPTPRSQLEVEDRRLRRAAGAVWELRGELFGGSEASWPAAAGAVAAASRAERGNGLVWHPVPRLWRRAAPVVRLDAAEVAAMFPSATARVPLPTFATARAATSIVLGRNDRGAATAITIDPGEGRHLLVLGETGMGKTTALLGAAVRATALGGVVLLDPIGDTCRRFLDRLPPAALGRVDWISPTLSPIGVNALRGAARPGPEGERSLPDLVQALRRVRAGRYADSPFWGPRVEEMVTLSLRAAACYPDGTIRTAAELLDAAVGHVGRVPPAAERAVQALVDRVRSRPDEVDGARRVLEEVVGSPTLERMLASPRATYSVAERARAGAIVLVSGDAAEVGESTSRVLLAVHFAILWSDLLAPGVARKVFVLADELPWYAHDAAAQMWRLARRFNVHLWATTQSLAALPEPVREAALTNSADTLVFRGSPDDAREIARWTATVPGELLLRLAAGEAALLRGKGADPERVRVDLGDVPSRPARWLAVADRCRPFAPPPEDEARDSRRPEPEPDGDSVEDLLLLLWAGALAEPAASSVTVVLEDLRAVLDGRPETVRAAGQRLAATAGFRASDGPAGREWSVDRSALATLLGSGVDPARLARADGRWALLAARSAARKSA